MEASLVYIASSKAIRNGSSLNNKLKKEGKRQRGKGGKKEEGKEGSKWY